MQQRSVTVTIKVTEITMKVKTITGVVRIPNVMWREGKNVNQKNSLWWKWKTCNLMEVDSFLLSKDEITTSFYFWTLCNGKTIFPTLSLLAFHFVLFWLEKKLKERKFNFHSKKIWTFNCAFPIFIIYIFNILHKFLQKNWRFSSQLRMYFSQIGKIS